MTGQLRSQTARAAVGLAVASDLPSGFVTFLLADIANSTRLVTMLGERYGAVLTDVRRILRTAVQASGGRVVDVRADELFAVFAEARAGIAAALAIQRKMQASVWPGDLNVLMRIGLHAGQPTLSDTGYVGVDVNTAARVCFAAHGGQIVVSSSVRDALEGAQAFRDLGVHQLHGLPTPVALFQLEVPDLPMDFPPPRVGVSGSAKPAGRRRPRPGANVEDGRS
jgi:class 3 adenylate cyclase